MTTRIRRAMRDDASRLNAALARLSHDLGDTHRASDDVLAQAGWGEFPAFRAQLAEANDETAGLVLYSPAFSTVRGGAGVYVSDLWVASDFRTGGLGKRLLHAALDDAGSSWNARYLRLHVYDHSARARSFYDRLGFVAATGHTDLILDAKAYAALKGSP